MFSPLAPLRCPASLGHPPLSKTKAAVTADCTDSLNHAAPDRVHARDARTPGCHCHASPPAAEVDPTVIIKTGFACGFVDRLSECRQAFLRLRRSPSSRRQ